jgi:hypothetical protein
MNFLEWSKSSVDYGQKLVNSALEGAHEAEDEFLKEESLASDLSESARHAFAPAMVGGAIGFGAGMMWENRDFAASVASGAWKKINETRDEHWFEKNPIDYA